MLVIKLFCGSAKHYSFNLKAHSPEHYFNIKIMQADHMHLVAFIIYHL